MARLNIDDRWWTDPRRERLAERVGGLEQADIAAIRAWRLAQEFWKNRLGLIPKTLFDSLKHAEHLVRTGLAEVRESFVYVRGSSSSFEWIVEQREQASFAGKKSAEARRKKDGTAQPKRRKSLIPSERISNALRTESNVVEPSYSSSCSSSLSESRSLNSATTEKNPKAGIEDGGTTEGGRGSTTEVWKAYRDAYEVRWKAKPPWNAKTGGMLKSLLERLGREAAPAVAAFYVSHNGARYMAAMHPVGLLLMDAEKLHTEWVTGRRMTLAVARDGEKQDVYQDQLRRIAEGSL